MSEKQAAVEVDANAPAPGITRVPLKYHKTVDGVECKYLDLRRPVVEDLLHAEKLGGSDAEREINQFAVLAGVAPTLIKKLDLADYLAVQKKVQAFLS